MTELTTNERNNAPATRVIGRPFQRGNPGRPKGSRNKLAEAFVADLYDDWQEHGLAAIQEVRATKPDAYLKVIASLLPKDVNLTTRSLDDLSDDQLMRKLAMLTEMARPLLAKLPTVIDVTTGTPAEPQDAVVAVAPDDINGLER